MVVYILHYNSLNTFRLPKLTSGSSFIQDYDSNYNLKNLITATAKNGKWYIQSDNYVQIIMNNKPVESCELSLYNFYLLKTVTNEPIILYPTLSYDNKYMLKEVVKDDTISFGKDNTCDVVLLRCANLAKKQFELTYKSGKWFAKNLYDAIPLYCNSSKISSCTLENFDTLFIMGFKIIIFGKMLIISNARQNVYTASPKLMDKTSLQYAMSTVDTTNQVFNDFYSPNEYFSKSPVFVKKSNTLKLDIASPNPKETGGSQFLIMSMIPTVLMSLTSLLSAFFTIKDYRTNGGNKEGLITSLVMCGVILFVSIIWPIFEYFMDKAGRFIKNTSNTVRYRKYMKEISEIFEQASAGQKMDLIFNNLSLKECEEAIRKRNSNLFSINNDQKRFLNIRLGTGRVKLDSEIGFDMTTGYETKDKLQKLAEDTIKKYEYIDEAPYSFSFKNSIAFINSNGEFSKYYESIILQLITFHDYYNLKLVVFTDDDSKLNLIRDLNHCWSDDQSIRYFATTVQEAEIISGQLIRILNKRRNSNAESSEKSSLVPHYLIITDNIYKYRNVSIINKIISNKVYYGFSELIFAHKLSEIPNGCKYFLEYTDKQSTLFESEMSDDTISKFVPEFIDSDVDFATDVDLVSNIPVVNNSDVAINATLPDKYGFLEMLNVGNVEQLNSVSRWKNSNVTNSLATPLGIDPTGSLLNLDLHEKAHGPHGLIAGMTGSGKSETIISYILSLAVNYSPNEVQFVLIDYKGGGLAGAFENRKTGIKLPHLVGTITNLDKASMNRTLVSIKSELQRRQRIFNTAKEELDIATIDIYKYQDLVRNGSIDEPMAHLFIICDEFAELKAQQPEFMDELVSAARIGRSLGIHLILATQKPSGVVDEQIWSNSKFKICAKVQTTEDSQEMIRKPDAAYIKEAGRFYLQVGYDEIFVKAQSAYTGVKYVPHTTTMITSGGPSSIVFIDNLGNILKSIKKEEKKISSKTDLGDELGNVTRYLIDCAKEIGFTNKQLWLDNVESNIFLNPLIKKYQYKEKKCIINPLIGEYDDPGNQKQGPVSINLSEKGNLWICGMTGSGKTTLLSTMIFSTVIHHSTDEVNIFVIDLITDSLKRLSQIPQVADVIVSSEHDRINKIFYFLRNEIERRKKILSVEGITFRSAAEKGKLPFPTLVVYVNGYDVLYDSYFELTDEIFTSITRDGLRVGIIFVLTSTRGINGKLEGSFSQRLALRFANQDDYYNVFDNINGIIPLDTPGRGLIDLGDIYEFQVCQVFDPDKYEDEFNGLVKQLKNAFPNAKGMPEMPKVVSYESVKNEIVTLDSVPIGFETISNCVHYFDFDNLINLVLYSEKIHAQGFEVALIKVLKKLENTKIVWLDALEVDEEIDGVKRYDSSFGNLTKSLYNSVIEKKSTNVNAEKIIFIISGYKAIESYLEKAKAEDKDAKTIDDLIVSSIGAKNYRFVLLESADTKSVDSRPWIDYYDYNRGILLSRSPDDQEIFDLDDANLSADTKYTRDIALSINQGIPTMIKYIRK
ncbi:MAG: type VII secretion protein EssC [Bacilli bacterium]|nr:type VII secretion protein EssC [Bacilli bacterium]